ncbi:DUF3786 domain-containing protein [Candidatus Electronema sp. TJ]|uniref:DUF3786 domain-containing protein n=1 Tax=Candidatus Electronema sp. TJ TaxID=3401573 RepID=UPI003AA806E3
MNPYQFLRYTPGSNCGECGWPTCLAFAAAVTKAGVPAVRCPHLKREGLPQELLNGSAAADADSLERGEEERQTVLAAHLRGKMQGLDLRQLAPRIGAAWLADTPDLLCFAFLNRLVRLSAAGILLDGTEPADPRDQILLYNYIWFGGAGSYRKSDGTWVGMESLPNSISKIRTLAAYCEERLAERFSGRVERLIELCAALGATPADQSADAAFVIPALPCVPLLLLFWNAEPEDGFAAKVKVLFDHHVLDFLDLESLVFTAERMADRLLELDR